MTGAARVLWVKRNGHSSRGRARHQAQPGRANTAKSFMWVALGGTPGKPVVLFRYHPTRAGSVAAEILGDFKGYLHQGLRSLRILAAANPTDSSHWAKPLKAVITETGSRAMGLRKAVIYPMLSTAAFNCWR